MRSPLWIPGSVPLPSGAPDIHALFADLEVALRRHRAREVRREGVELTFKFGIPTLARWDGPFRVIDGGHLFADGNQGKSSVGFELHVRTLVLSTALFFSFEGALALSGRVTDPLGLGLFALVMGVGSIGTYLWSLHEFKAFIISVASGPPNRRLEPARRMIKE